MKKNDLYYQYFGLGADCTSCSKTKTKAFPSPIIPIFNLPTNPSNTLVSGSIKDAIGPLEGANIYVKDNPTVGTSSNFNGEFRLENIEPNTTIVVSFLGYKTITFQSGGGFKEIFMQEDAEMLDAVVVTAPKKNKTLKIAGLSLLAIAIIIGLTKKSETVQAIV